MPWLSNSDPHQIILLNIYTLYTFIAFSKSFTLLRIKYLLSTSYFIGGHTLEYLGKWCIETSDVRRLSVILSVTIRFTFSWAVTNTGLFLTTGFSLTMLNEAAISPPVDSHLTPECWGPLSFIFVHHFNRPAVIH